MAILDSRPEETREMLDSIFINPQDWETVAVYDPNSGETISEWERRVNAELDALLEYGSAADKGRDE